MYKRIICLSVAAALIFSLLSGCGNSEDKPDVTQTQDNKLTVAVSIVPQKTFVEAVCGENAEIITMVPPGSSPETFEPTPMMMEDFSKADIYFTIGVPTEQSSILPNVADSTKVVHLEDEVAEAYDDLTFEGEGRDPHIWMSPKRVIVMINSIERELSSLDSENSALYRANADEYIAQLESKDTEIKSALQNVQNRTFIVFHPAFAYFADDYQLTMYSLEQNGKEALAEHLQEMIDLAREQGIKVIFYQAETDSSQCEAFAEEIGGKTVMLEPLAENYIENLGIMAQVIAEAME